MFRKVFQTSLDFNLVTMDTNMYAFKTFMFFLGGLVMIQ